MLPLARQQGARADPGGRASKGGCGRAVACALRSSCRQHSEACSLARLQRHAAQAQSARMHSLERGSLQMERPDSGARARA